MIITYLFSVLEFFTIKAVEQQGKKEIEHHEITHYERGQKYEETAFSAGDPFRPHTIPKRLNPLPTKNSEDHHERMEKVVEIPPKYIQSN